MVSMDRFNLWRKLVSARRARVSLFSTPRPKTKESPIKMMRVASAGLGRVISGFLRPRLFKATECWGKALMAEEKVHWRFGIRSIQ